MEVSPDIYSDILAGESAYLACRVTYSDNQRRRWETEATYELRGVGVIAPVHVGVPKLLDESDQVAARLIPEYLVNVPTPFQGNVPPEEEV